MNVTNRTINHAGNNGRKPNPHATPPQVVTTDFRTRRAVDRLIREGGRMVAPPPKPPALPPLYAFMVKELRRAFKGLSGNALAWRREDCAQVSRVLGMAQAALQAQEEGYAPFRAPSLCELEAEHERAVNIRQEWEAYRAELSADDGEEEYEQEEEPQRACKKEQAQDSVPEPVAPPSDPWEFVSQLFAGIA